MQEMQKQILKNQYQIWVNLLLEKNESLSTTEMRTL